MDQILNKPPTVQSQSLLVESAPMSSRKRRHTRSTFSDLVHPNFEELSREFPDFGMAWQVVRQLQRERGGSFASNVTQEFSITITKALLHTYFSLSLPRIPTLCPAIPNRYFFVRWIRKDLLPLMEKESYFEPASDRSVSRAHLGIDLGTGATCIYPLLFLAPSVELEDHDSAMTNDWRWLASEVDPSSVADAKHNVKANNLESKIFVVQVAPTDCQEKETGDDDVDQMSEDDEPKDGSHTGPLLRLLEALPEEARPLGVIDVVMTNPPFHDAEAEWATQAGGKRPCTTLTKQEASYPEGEANFVIDLIVDSLCLLPNKILGEGQEKPLTATWFASMFGKKPSWNQLRGALTYMLGPARVQTTEFGPGDLTRWFLAWTYCRPCVRSPSALYKHNRNTSSRKASLSQNLTNHPNEGYSFISFDVTVQGGCDVSRGVVNEVVDRVVAYFRIIRGYTFNVEFPAHNGCVGTPTLTIREETPHVEEWNDNKLPTSVLRALRTRQISFMDFLPREGHFLMDVLINSRSTTTARVSARAFVHSPYGQQAVRTIENHLEAEVCRTTRRWRRLLERQQQGEEQAEPMQS